MYEALAEIILAVIMGGGLALAGILIVLIWKTDRTRKVSYLRLVIQIATVVGVFFSFTQALWLSVFVRPPFPGGRFNLNLQPRNSRHRIPCVNTPAC